MAQSLSNQRPSPSTVSEHLSGTSDSWHSKITPSGPFRPSPTRYHMYVGLFCPFAHRANIVRTLKGLESIIPISIVKPYPKGDSDGWPGWQFPVPSDSDSAYPGATEDQLFRSKYLHEVYFKADPGYKGRYSVPVLWDKETDTIVNNESAELLRDLQTCFDELLRQDGKPKQADLTLYPEHLRARIDEIAEWMQSDLNTGVYKAGFAPDQETYEKNVIPVFAALNKLEKIVKDNKGPFVLGKELSELDVRLFATLIRFDTVYVQHFKCNLGMIRKEYPVLNNWMKGLYWNKSGGGYDLGAFGKKTVDFKHIKENYTKSHDDLNPKHITPKGPWPNVEEGYESDWSRIEAGGIDMPEVVEREKKYT